MPELNEHTTQQLDILFSNARDIPDKPKEYLFEPIITVGSLNGISGDPGVGKSKATYAIAARVTRGLPLLNLPCACPGNVLMFSAEDDASDIKKTFLAAGGDLSKLFVLSETESALSWLKDHPLTFSSSIIEQAIIRYNPVLVVFDPFQRYCGRIDINNGQATNSAFMPLTILARKYHTSILIVSHNGKGERNSLMSKTLGSMDIIGNMRSLLTIVSDPEKPSECIMIHSKSNNKKSRSIRYRILSIPGDENFAKVEFLALEDYTERDYKRALKRSEEKEFETQIEDSDPNVVTVLNLIRDNPTGVRLRRDDFWKACEVYTGEAIATTSDALVKKYRHYCWDKYGIFIDTKSSQALRPFRVNAETLYPSKTPDRCIAIYKKKTET